MDKNIGRTVPAHPFAGRVVEGIAHPLVRALGAALRFYDAASPYARQKGQEMRDRLSREETLYLLGICPSGHNSTAALVEVSAKNGIRPICNNEEERYTGRRHDDRFPQNALKDIFHYLEKTGVDPAQVLAVVASWNYLAGIPTALRVAAEEAPESFHLARKAASPQMNLWHFIEALGAPKRLSVFFHTERRVPVIGMRHHDNHAFFPYAVSPFARSSRPTLILVIDGFGDDGAMSIYVAEKGNVDLLRRVPHLFDSLGFLYAIISSTQGGWTTLSSEGRFMGATAWGDMDRLTNPYYKRLRQIVYFGPEGEVRVNRSLINYHRRGQLKPYSPRLVEIIGEPIPLEKMWNPDAVLRMDDEKLSEVTQERVDKAAALQMVFEDALFHIVDHFIRLTGSNQLILSGGTALNCLANMNLLERFSEEYYSRYLKKENLRLHLWVPPNPSDTGAAMGACYNFAMSHGAPLGPPLKHAFLCGWGTSDTCIEDAISQAKEMKSMELGRVDQKEDREAIADLLAHIIAQDGVIGLFQGASETGPRALGHRSILANPCNPETLNVLNQHVKYRERFRPLAPMVTLEAAERLFFLSEGASDDHYNAYNYMVLTVRSKPEAVSRVPAVIHKDGTSRIQIVREETDPFCYALLKAMGRRLGVEAVVNTSLNVGTPIVQTPAQAMEALRRSRGMTGLVLIGDTGRAFLVWHNVLQPPKDGGAKLLQWVADWSKPRANVSGVTSIMLDSLCRF